MGADLVQLPRRQHTKKINMVNIYDANEMAETWPYLSL